MAVAGSMRDCQQRHACVTGITQSSCPMHTVHSLLACRLSCLPCCACKWASPCPGLPFAQVDGVRIYHDQALFKGPGGGHTPWHCDQVQAGRARPGRALPFIGTGCRRAAGSWGQTHWAAWRHMRVRYPRFSMVGPAAFAPPSPLLCLQTRRLPLPERAVLLASGQRQDCDGLGAAGAGARGARPAAVCRGLSQARPWASGRHRVRGSRSSRMQLASSEGRLASVERAPFCSPAHASRAAGNN